MKTSLKIFSLLALMLFKGQLLLAQHTPLVKANQIKLTPFRTIDPVNPGLEISFEKLHSNQYSSQVAVGYMKDLFSTVGISDYKGLRLGFEEKLFLNNTRRNRRYYSAEVVYLKAKYTDCSSYIKDTVLRTPKYIDTFGVRKQTLSFNIKYGIQIPLGHFILDLYAGIGLKYKMVERNNLEDRNAYEIHPRHPNAYFIGSKEGNSFAVSLPLNIKVGYQF